MTNNIIDSYLAQVGQYLPAETRDDVLTELRTDIAEQIEAGAAEQTGVADSEIARDVLKRYGHPLKVASSFKSQHYLIGPALFPPYLEALKTTAGIAFVAALLFTLAFGDTWSGVGVVWDLADRWLSIMLWGAGILTLVFVALESAGERLSWYDDWNPESLPDAPTGGFVYSDVVTNLVTEAVFLLWWNDVILGDGGASEALDPVAMGAIWQSLFWPLNLLFGAFLVLHAYVLVLGRWPRWASLAELVLCIALAGALAALLVDGQLLEFPATTADGFAQWVDRTVRMVLLVIGGFTIWDAALATKRIR